MTQLLITETREITEVQDHDVTFAQLYERHDPLMGDPAYDDVGPLFDEVPLSHVQTEIRNFYFIDS